MPVSKLAKRNENVKSSKYDKEIVANYVSSTPAKRFAESKYDDDDDFDYGFGDNANREVKISSNLMKVLGMKVSNKKVTSDWKAPSQYGLANSESLIPKNNSLNLVEFTESRLYKRQSKGLIKSIILSVPSKNNAEPPNSSSKKLSQAPVRSIVRSPRKRSGSVNSTGSNKSRNNDDENDNDGDDNDDEDEDYGFEVDRPVNLSYNLLVELGLEDQNDDTNKLKTDWKPPTFHGLSNSTRIIPIKSTPGNLLQVQFADSPRKMSSTAETSKVQEKGNNNTNNADRSITNVARTNIVKREVDEEEEEEDEEDDDDDDNDDDDDDDDDEEEEEFTGTSIVMSANLMKALGMDISNVDTTTDWKPPEFTGVENSKRYWD